MLVYQNSCILAIHRNFRLYSRSIVDYIGHKPEICLLKIWVVQKKNSLSIHKNTGIGEGTIP